jgi:tetratricopeptide (TPR) repeat protein
MVDRRPDFASYARISYARELQGDVAGAIELMQRAITAGGPIVEHTAWGYVQLGNLQFGRGALADAAQNYELALQFLKSYPPALAGQARVLAAQGDLRQATGLLQQALDRMPLPEYAIALGDIYARLGDQQQAQRQYALVEVLNKLFTASGVNTDMETALYFADHNIDIPASVAQARKAYAARPSIHAADALAWTLYRSGNYEEAQRYSDEALHLGTRDALKLFHAGMIAYARGDNDRARTQLASAAAINPHFSLIYADELAKTLQALGAAPLTRGGE